VESSIAELRRHPLGRRREPWQLPLPLRRHDCRPRFPKKLDRAAWEARYGRKSSERARTRSSSGPGQAWSSRRWEIELVEPSARASVPSVSARRRGRRTRRQAPRRSGRQRWTSRARCRTGWRRCDLELAQQARRRGTVRGGSRRRRAGGAAQSLTHRNIGPPSAPAGSSSPCRSVHCGRPQRQAGSKLRPHAMIGCDARKLSGRPPRTAAPVFTGDPRPS